MAQRLCDGFDKISDDAPMMQFQNRLRLMKQHFSQVDADVIGLSEVDTKSDRNVEAHLALLKMMGELGYAYHLFEKGNKKTASGVFFKKDKFDCLHAE